MKELTTAPDGLNLIETFHEVYLAVDVDARLEDERATFESFAGHHRATEAEVARLTRDRDEARAANYATTSHQPVSMRVICVCGHEYLVSSDGRSLTMQESH